MGVRLELLNEKEELITFKKEKIMARKVREAMEMNVKNAEANELEMLDNMLDYVVDLFDKPELTNDTILDGLESHELVPTLQKLVGDVMGMDEEAIKKGNELAMQMA